MGLPVTSIRLSTTLGSLVIFDFIIKLLNTLDHHESKFIDWIQYYTDNSFPNGKYFFHNGEKNWKILFWYGTKRNYLEINTHNFSFQGYFLLPKRNDFHPLTSFKEKAIFFMRIPECISSVQCPQRVFIVREDFANNRFFVMLSQLELASFSMFPFSTPYQCCHQ